MWQSEVLSQYFNRSCTLATWPRGFPFGPMVSTQAGESATPACCSSTWWKSLCGHKDFNKGGKTKPGRGVKQRVALLVLLAYFHSRCRQMSRRCFADPSVPGQSLLCCHLCSLLLLEADISIMDEDGSLFLPCCIFF